MQLVDLIESSRVACAVNMSSKKKALEQLSQLIIKGDASLRAVEVFESLVARERLGSTGLGKGIALPHGRLKSSNKTIVAFLKLSTGVDYDAPDDEPVDLLCALLVPAESTEEHIQVLAVLSEMFSNNALRDKLRMADNRDELYQLLINWSANA